ncbi:hypothetical protein PAXRUDRAFT_139761 [Paxillus rubicundulus Ve08.2h10]|uniref:Uncharacterized protein n=1 Tax=Paxillus rubicundulus Ve08.2h10 TaxID=930991 RepID=A0A0D0E442_9AGAM|nr:hypothetical protein PAXRUDRAFT_139761 [Paxillus rubicundulus Ve08.2h10]
MRRRGPPSALRLFQGPLPPRSQPKHTLPSIPLPAFHPAAALPHGPTPAPRSRPTHVISPDLPPLDLAVICGPNSSGDLSSTPTSSPTKRLRGPWDDSSSVALVVDVDSILAMPKPVAIGV